MNTTDLRVIASPYETPDVDEDTAERIEAALADGSRRLRRSAVRSTNGQEDYQLELLAYTDLDGEERFAVRHQRPEGSELKDSGAQEVADAEYEREAREMQECGCPWDTTDVPGLTPAGYEYRVEASTDGGSTWTALATGSGSLNHVQNPDYDLDDIAAQRGEDELMAIETNNAHAALERVTGLRLIYPGPFHTDRLRAVVTQDGEEAALWERTFDQVEPTPEAIAEFTATFEAIALSDELSAEY